MVRLVTLVALLCSAWWALAGVGDEFERVRGSDFSGLRYDALVRTPTGRLIAVGSDGKLMISDNGGSDWRFDGIRINGEPMAGRVSELLMINGQITGLVTTLEPETNRFGLPFTGKTRILTSSDNGQNWSLTDFPLDTAFFDGQPFPGVFLGGLFRAENGELLAYGTTAVAQFGLIYFIGGAVFRRTGSSWQQSYFELGRVNSMAQSGGRLFAAGFQTVIDSVDALNWNGYAMRDAQMMVGGQLLDFEVSSGLNASDVGFENGDYVMEVQAFRKRNGIFFAGAERAFTFRSPNPFDGGRLWQGTEHGRVYPSWLSIGGSILSMFGGINRLGSGGQSWSLQSNDVRLSTRSFTAIDANSIIAVESSEQVWRSDDGGSTWQSVFERPTPVTLRDGVLADGVLYARAGDFNSPLLFRSLDNGTSWMQIADIEAQTGRSLNRLKRSGSLLYGPQAGANVALSTDGGFTWQQRSIPIAADDAVLDIVEQNSGRWIIAPEGGFNDPFYFSDDRGLSWQASDPVDLSFGLLPGPGVALSNGRVIFILNGFASFDPRLIISDDNGQSWRFENPFQDVAGLDTVAGGDQVVIDLAEIFQLRNGRLIILGNDEIIFSDDNGDTWQLGRNLEEEQDGFQDWGVYDLAEIGNRVFVLAYAELEQGRRRVMFISEDGGQTWRENILPTDQGNAFLARLFVGQNNRLIATGVNGTVVVSDAELTPPPAPESFTVRESETLGITVPRPPFPGAIEVRYQASGTQAIENADFNALDGVLTWADGDDSFRVISLITIDDTLQEQPEGLTIEAGVAGELQFDWGYEVDIVDNDGLGFPSVQVLAEDVLETSEAGATAEFRLALTFPTDQPVTVSLDNRAAEEISLSTQTLTFTTDDWRDPQTVVVTGLDDVTDDGDSAARIVVTVTSSDPAYDEEEPFSVYVINRDDELSIVFADGFE